MKYTGAYLIGSQTLRLYSLESQKSSNQWLSTETNQPETWTVATLRERMIKVFKVVKYDLKCLVLVNSTQMPLELLQLAYDIGSQHAKEVYIISATMARLQWAITETKLNYLNVGDKALIACFINDIYEFDELEVCSSSKYVLNSVTKCPKNEAKDMLRERLNSIKPKSVVFVSTHEIMALKKWFEAFFTGKFHYIVEKPDYILLNGGLAKANTSGNFQSLFNIQDFASGYQIEYTTKNGNVCDVLIPFNEKLPCKNTVQLTKIQSFCVKYNEEITVAPVIPPSFAKGCLQSAILYGKTQAENITVNADINKYGYPSIKIDVQSDTDIPAPFDTDLSNMTLNTKRNVLNESRTEFVIKLKANMGSIWSKTDKKEFALLNINQNEWTPFFISFRRAEMKIGEKAASDNKKYPKSVIKDVHKVIGLPFNKIVIDERWEFGIVPTPDDPNNSMFEIETVDGRRQFSAIAIMSMFTMALKKIAERQFNIGIKNIFIQVSPQDYKPDQLRAVKNAVENVGMKVENIEYMNS